MKIAERYQMCTRCIMDTTDPEIEFDENGVCNHCRNYDLLAPKFIKPEDVLLRELDQLVREIKNKGKGRDYDCVIGVSGGVDSSYVAYTVKQLGLRPLAVHMDNGWDSELAVSNIEKFLNRLNIDLYTVVLDWEEFRDLQIAFLKASVPDGEIPTDHAIWAVLYKAAAERGIPYIISGFNFATEAFIPPRWTYGHFSWNYIKNVHRKFGKYDLLTFPHLSFAHKLYYLFIRKVEVVPILNYIKYDKQAALQFLEKELGWRPYGGKHYESIYTRFFQGYILPRKFNIDKRKAHLSALILSGQMNRQDAIQEIQKPPYSGYMLEDDMEYILKKFEFTEDEFDRIMSLPVKTYKDYPSSVPAENMVRSLRIGRIAKKLGILTTRRAF